MGVLLTDREYSNFELYLEVKMDSAPTEIFLRSTERGSAYQVELIGDGLPGTGDLLPERLTISRGATAANMMLLLVLTACGREATPDAQQVGIDAAPVALAEPPRAPVRDTVLEEAFRMAAAELDGSVGIAALHLQRNVAASFNGVRPFALASIAKLPVAYAALLGEEVAPQDVVVVAPTDRAPGETPFAPGTEVTVARLVERSLAHSDNTGSDVLLRLARGPAEVERRLRQLGVEGVRIDRSMKEIFAAWRGIRDVEGIAEWTIAEFERRATVVPAEVRVGAQMNLARDPRDSGTAEGIRALLSALHRGEGLRPEARQVLLEGMRGAVTGPNRIRAGVPPGTEVAHKTGTLGPLSHDVGIVTLPGGGEVALVVLVESDAPVAARERVITSAARAVWERFAGEAGAGGGEGP